jgi:hypothetical protein
MKAIRQHARGGPQSLRYEDAPKPSPKAGEVPVRVRAAGERTQPGYRRPNFCDLIAANPLGGLMAQTLHHPGGRASPGLRGRSQSRPGGVVG